MIFVNKRIFLHTCILKWLIQDFEAKLLRNFKAEILEFSFWIFNIVPKFSTIFVKVSYFVKIVLNLCEISMLNWKNRLKCIDKDIPKACKTPYEPKA